MTDTRAIVSVFAPAARLDPDSIPRSMVKLAAGKHSTLGVHQTIITDGVLSLVGDTVDKRIGPKDLFSFAYGRIGEQAISSPGDRRALNLQRNSGSKLAR